MNKNFHCELTKPTWSVNIHINRSTIQIVQDRDLQGLNEETLRGPTVLYKGMKVHDGILGWTILL